MLELLTQPEAYVSLLTLTAMEIVLGIDNIVFIAILTDELPREKQAFARRLGLSLALISRLALLFAISWVMGLTEEVFELLGRGWSGRDLILLGGGLFLIGKATHEIYNNLEGDESEEAGSRPAASLPLTIAQIAVLDIVFSLDSVITAVGMAEHLSIMVTAVVIAVGVMLLAAGPIGDFVNRHPSMKILALSFLLLIGVMLTAEGTGRHIAKGYIYSAMGFSLMVELLNMRLRKKRAPVQLRAKYGGTPASG